MVGHRYSTYQALSWAEGKTDDEVREELARVSHTLRYHTFQWDEVGNRADTLTRYHALHRVLDLRRTITAQIAERLITGEDHA